MVNTIKDIVEIKNKSLIKQKPIKEKMDIIIPNISTLNIPNRNGFIYCLCGSGGSGKTNVLLNFFKSKKMYRNVFDNIYYFCPSSSFLSVDKHPFINHDKIYHELSAPILDTIYDELIEIKESRKDKKRQFYNMIILDDWADCLKENEIISQLNKMIIKARHLNCCFVFTLQSYYYMPKIIRKQLTNITLFKSKNIVEFDSIAKELLNVNKDDALKLYNYIFDEPYMHLDINTVDNNYCKNFNLLELIY